MRSAKSAGDLQSDTGAAIRSAKSVGDLVPLTSGDSSSLSPVSFQWRDGGESVEVYGSWTDPAWEVPFSLVKPKLGDSTVHSITVNLPIGIHSYKFMVDGEWMFAKEQPILPDRNGNINNCISVTRVRVAPAIPAAWSPSHVRRKSGGHKGKLLHAQLLLPGVSEITRRALSLHEGGLRRSVDTSVLRHSSSFTAGPSATSTASLASPAPSFPDVANRHTVSAPSSPRKPQKAAKEQEPKEPQEPKKEPLSDSSDASLDESGLRGEFLSHFVDGGVSDLEQPKHRLLLVMVGLPARGKSFIARKLAHYLRWLGFRSKVFNLGNYRRKNLGCFQSQGFFHPDNPQGLKARQRMAELALQDVMSWYREQNGHIAVYDGTNSTAERREWLLERVKKERPGLHVKTIFIEILCNDPEIIEANIRATKLSSPDYKDMNPEDAVKDFVARIENYKLSYETLGQNDDYRFIKIFEVGRQIVGNRINGFVPGRVLFYLNNLHIIPREIYLCRHGQSMYNLTEKLGGDSPLTPLGEAFAGKLQEFMKNQVDANDLCVWSSTMKRAVQTSENIPCVQYVRWRAMEEIQVGVCDGMTYKEVEEQMPEEFAARQRDKLGYRYPRGESYEDLIRRLDPVIIELERHRKPILIVAHRAVLRCLYAYFAEEEDRERVPHISIPLHTVIKLTPMAYGTQEERFKLMEGDE